MSEKDFDKGYKSGFKFGKEVANEKWLNKVKQVREDIENLTPWDEGAVEMHEVLEILDGLIAESEN